MMNQNEIQELQKYEKSIRKMAVRDRLAFPYEIACMTFEEVYNLVSDKYRMVFMYDKNEMAFINPEVFEERAVFVSNE